MDQKKLDYFLREKTLKNPIFFRRFPKIEFKNLRIIDLGCGHGALSVDLALKRAKIVVGIDIDENRINFAKRNLLENYPELIHNISFLNQELKNLDSGNYDLIISKASFEHIIELEKLLIEMREKLLIGGKILSGFGPLYRSPWGDHNRLRHKLPWTHLIFSEKYFIKKLNRKRIKQIKSIYDLGLNGLSLMEYKKIFNSIPGLELIDFRTNVSEKPLMKFFNFFSKLPFLKEYFTYNIYCVLERKY